MIFQYFTSRFHLVVAHYQLFEQFLSSRGLLGQLAKDYEAGFLGCLDNHFEVTFFAGLRINAGQLFGILHIYKLWWEI
jgi:hypothetical protein